MLVIDRAAAINAAAALGDRGGYRVAPRVTTDGRLALPEGIVDHPGFAGVASLLEAGTVEPTASFLPFSTNTPAEATLLFPMDGKLMWRAGPAAALTSPAPDVYRFAPAANAFAGAYDSNNNNKRSEIVDVSADRNIGLESAWSAFSLILGDHVAMSATGLTSHFALVHQWHSVDTAASGSRSPVLAIDIARNQLTIITRSSASGGQVVRYTSPVPAKGEVNHFVFNPTFGASGHLNVWRNGTQVVNADMPIGYYDDPGGQMAYVQWGLYSRNRRETDVCYIANPESGRDSLAARITSPLPVPALEW